MTTSGSSRKQVLGGGGGDREGCGERETERENESGDPWCWSLMIPN